MISFLLMVIWLNLYYCRFENIKLNILYEKQLKKNIAENYESVISNYMNKYCRLLGIEIKNEIIGFNEYSTNYKFNGLTKLAGSNKIENRIKVISNLYPNEYTILLINTTLNTELSEYDKKYSCGGIYNVNLNSTSNIDKDILSIALENIFNVFKDIFEVTIPTNLKENDLDKIRENIFSVKILNKIEKCQKKLFSDQMLDKIEKQLAINKPKIILNPIPLTDIPQTLDIKVKNVKNTGVETNAPLYYENSYPKHSKNNIVYREISLKEQELHPISDKINEKPSNIPIPTKKSKNITKNEEINPQKHVENKNIKDETIVDEKKEEKKKLENENTDKKPENENTDKKPKEPSEKGLETILKSTIDLIRILTLQNNENPRTEKSNRKESTFNDNWPTKKYTHKKNMIGKKEKSLSFGIIPNSMRI